MAAPGEGGPCHGGPVEGDSWRSVLSWHWRALARRRCSSIPSSLRAGSHSCRPSGAQAREGASMAAHRLGRPSAGKPGRNTPPPPNPPSTRGLRHSGTNRRGSEPRAAQSWRRKGAKKMMDKNKKRLGLLLRVILASNVSTHLQSPLPSSPLPSIADPQNTDSDSDSESRI